MSGSAPAVDNQARAANDKDAVSGAVVRDLIGQPMPAEPPGESEEQKNARDRKKNSAVQKLLRQIEQRVKELRVYAMTGLTCDEEQDKIHAVHRIASISQDLAKFVLDMQDTV